MPSITIRNLDKEDKQALRVRAARNGRSMEEEARLLFATLRQDKGSVADHSVPAGSPAAPDDKTPPQHPAGAVAISADQKPMGNFAGFPAAGKSVLLVITGGIAAYKCLDLIRRLRERDVKVTAVMTRAAHEFVTPLSVGALSAQKVFTDLFDREDETDVGHIRLARQHDLIAVIPATADFISKMAHGQADDLASTILLAARSPVLIAPAMNPAMWDHPATRANVKTITDFGIKLVGPGQGEMAESGEAGTGRMAEPLEIVAAIGDLLDTRPKPLKGKRAIVTSGPTREAIDPVRYIANRSSGKQGYAIAGALADLGAEVILISGPVNISPPTNVEIVRVESAREMQKATEAALPADIAVMVAAVADWRSKNTSDEKMKKQNGKGPGMLELTENPDILKGLGHHKQRPRLLIGFAAETNDLEKHARAKLKRKKADWIVANDVSPDSGIGAAKDGREGGVMGGDANRVKILSDEGIEAWPELSKQEVAHRIGLKIVKHFQSKTITA